MSDQKPLTVIGLEAENYKCLKAVRIIPPAATGLVTITGKNAQGKTTILDSIQEVFAGKGGVCEEPIRKGQDEFRIRLDLGELVAEVTQSRLTEKRTLKIKGKGGTVKESPQSLWDRLCKLITFDPLLFTRMRPDEQVALLAKLVGLDFKESNAKRATLYTERELKGRELRAAKAKLPEFPYHADTPEQPVSVEESQAKLKVIQGQRAENAKVRAAVSSHKFALGDAMRRAEELRAAIEGLNKQLKQAQDLLEKANSMMQAETLKLQSAEAEASKLVEDDESQVLADLRNIEAINSKVRANQLHAKANEDIQKHQHDYDALTVAIEAIDQEKKDQLEWAEFPLEGLSFDDSQVLLHGVRFTQCSQAQQLTAAVAIGLALNPTVRVILIRDGSLLDDEHMKLVGEMAAKSNAQIWIEVVNSTDPAAIVIEDGEVRA